MRKILSFYSCLSVLSNTLILFARHPLSYFDWSHARSHLFFKGMFIFFIEYFVIHFLCLYSLPVCYLLIFKQIDYKRILGYLKKFILFYLKCFQLIFFCNPKEKSWLDLWHHLVLGWVTSVANSNFSAFSLLSSQESTMIVL